MGKLRNAKGFTLIELMIVVAIVALLARIAFPSYQEFVRRGNRAEAHAAIMNMAQLQERNFTDRGVYVTVTSGSGVGAPWSSYNWSGSNFASRKYDITVASDTTPAYTITATPVTVDPTCGNLTLTSDGTRGAGGDVTYCWK